MLWLKRKTPDEDSDSGENTKDPSEKPWDDVPEGYSPVDVQITSSDGYSITAGPIYLTSPSSLTSHMPFDISTRKAQKKAINEDTGEEETSEITVADIRGGRVYLPGGKIVTIPDKSGLELPVSPDGVKFIMLTITRGEDNDLQYSYDIADNPYTPENITEKK